MTTFLIKVCSMDQFIHPRGGKANPSNNTDLVRHKDIHERMHWKFQRVDGEWGYIVHATSNKCIHPKGGSENPEKRAILVLTDDRRNAALFKFDLNNNEIVHKGGKIATTFIDPVADFIDLTTKPPFPYELIKFECVSPTNIRQKINPYE